MSQTLRWTFDTAINCKVKPCTSFRQVEVSDPWFQTRDQRIFLSVVTQSHVEHIAKWLLQIAHFTLDPQQKKQNIYG